MTITLYESVPMTVLDVATIPGGAYPSILPEETDHVLIEAERFPFAERVPDTDDSPGAVPTVFAFAESVAETTEEPVVEPEILSVPLIVPETTESPSTCPTIDPFAEAMTYAFEPPTEKPLRFPVA